MTLIYIYLLRISIQSGLPEDQYSPLMEVKCSSRAFLYLQPLAHSGVRLSSVQINAAPLTCTLLREGWCGLTWLDPSLCACENCARVRGNFNYRSHTYARREKGLAILDQEKCAMQTTCM